MPEMEKTLRAQKIISPGMKVTSTTTGNTLQFSIFPDKEIKESANTLKIRAVLLAKNIMTADKTLQRLDVRFHGKDTPDDYTEVTVRSVDVKAFGAGLTTEDELLNSLQMTENGHNSSSGNSSNSPEKTGSVDSVLDLSATSEGARREERAKLSERVQALKAKGVGIKPFLLQLSAADELAKPGDSIQLQEKLEQLNSSVADQEKVLADRVKPNLPTRTEVPLPAALQRNAAARATTSAGGMPTVGQARSPITSLLGSPTETAPLMRIFEGWAKSATERYGIAPELIPEGAPYFGLRWNLALQVKYYRDKFGDGIMPMWYQCQELAKQGDKVQVAYKMQNLAKAMKLPDPFKYEDWYKEQMDAYKEQFHHHRQH